MSRRIPLALLALLLVIVMSGHAFATTYYIAANGSDSNSGTSKSSPWLHAPGMTTCSATCSSTNINAGDSLIFRGGDTWHFGNSSLSPFAGFQNDAWNWSRSGSSGNCNLDASAGSVVTTSCIYIGVDQTWFTGSSWTRPVLNMDNPLSTSSPSSCSYDDSGKNIWVISGNYVIVDNFEFTGYCWNSTSPGASLFGLGSHNELRNSYFHGWTMGQTATGCGGCDSDEYFAVGGSFSVGSYLRIDYNVFDGSDSTYGTSSNKASEGVFAVGGGEIDHNILNHVSNGMKYDQAILVHDNFFENMYEPVVGGTHGNVMEWSPTNYTVSTYYFNNLVDTTGEGETIDMYPGSSSSSKHGYVFNNIMWGVGNASNCYMGEGDGSGGPGSFYLFNNTTDNPCFFVEERGSGAAIFQNNHFIGYSPQAVSAFSNMTGTDKGNEVWQSESTANSQGYVPSNNYAPTASSNATVGAGANLTSLCTSMDNSIAVAACENGYAGVTYNTSNHTAVANTPIARASSGSWDAGAYVYSASGSVNPPTGLAASVQ
ncbi:MAG: hypothetical protein WB421_13230 [Terriglobales bacterium]